MHDTSAPAVTSPSGRSRASGRATIEDVALAADVSVATVSRALRGLPNVADSTRLRVRRAADELQYVPDPAAARLAAGRTRTITVAVPALEQWYYANVVGGAEHVARSNGYELQVVRVATPDDRDRLLDERRHVERRTDGLIFVDIAVTDEQVASLQRRGVDLTTIGARAADRPVVGIDDERVGEIAAEHLVGLGHRVIAMMEGSIDDPLDFAVPRARRRGFERGLGRHGLELDPELTVDGGTGIPGARSGLSRLLDSPRPPTAVFTMCDEMAFGVLVELRARDLVAGIDVSVLGVDDHDFSPVAGLSTIRQPVRDHGERAAELLIASMRHREPWCGPPTADASAPGARPLDDGVDPLVHRAPIELVARSTTGPPPSVAALAD